MQKKNTLFRDVFNTFWDFSELLPAAHFYNYGLQSPDEWVVGFKLFFFKKKNIKEYIERKRTSSATPSGLPPSMSFLFFMVGISDIQALSLLCLDKKLKIISECTSCWA